MKKTTLWILAALLVCGVAVAGQLSTTWTLRNVVDPPDLRDGLNADAQAADARLDAIETYSNATAEVTYSNLTLNGDATIAGDATITGTLTGSVVSSNATGELTSSNGTFNGDVTIAGTLGVTEAITASGGITGYSLSAATFDTVTIVGVTNGALTNLVTVQAKDIGGVNMARACSFPMWIAAYATQSTPSTNNIESFSTVQGDVNGYWGVPNGANPVYIITTSATGLWTANVVGTAAGTNVMRVVTGNGKLVTGNIVFAE